MDKIVEAVVATILNHSVSTDNENIYNPSGIKVLVADLVQIKSSRLSQTVSKCK